MNTLFCLVAQEDPLSKNVLKTIQNLPLRIFLFNYPVCAIIYEPKAYRLSKVWNDLPF